MSLALLESDGFIFRVNDSGQIERGTFVPIEVEWSPRGKWFVLGLTDYDGPTAIVSLGTRGEVDVLKRQVDGDWR